MNTICMTSVTKQYGHQVTALKDVDLTVHAGKFIVVMGQSGSGKAHFCRLQVCLTYQLPAAFQLTEQIRRK